MVFSAIERISGVQWRAQGPAFLVAGGHSGIHWIIATIYILLPFIREDLGLSYTEAGSLITIFHTAALFANVGSGAIVDITGQRVLTQVASLLLGGIALTLVGLAKDFWILAILLVFVGLTHNFWHPAAIAYLSQIYPENRGYSLSLHTLGASLGDTIAPLFAGLLLVWFPWEEAASFSALPVFAVAFALFMILGREDQVERRMGGTQSSMRLKDYLLELVGLFKDRAIVGLCIMAGFRSMCQNGLLVYLPMLLKNIFGFGPVLLGTALTVMQIGGMISGPLAGIVSDKAGRRPVVLGGIVASTLIVFSFTLTMDPIVIFVMLGLLGFFLFAVRPVIHGWAMDLTPSQMHGSGVSLLFGTQSAFSLLVPVLAGLVADTWGLSAVFYGLTGAMFVATILTFLMPKNR